MARTIEEIAAIITARKRSMGLPHEAMRDAMKRYEGDLVVALPEMDRTEKPLVANLVAEGIDQTGMRCADLLPNMTWPAVDRKKLHGPRSLDYANIRHLAVASWWQQNQMELKLHRFYRFLCGMGSSPLQVWPNFTHGIPVVEQRHPLFTFPSPSKDPITSQPLDVGFQYIRTAEWLRVNYPAVAAQIQSRFPPNKRWTGQEEFEVTEWHDVDQIVLFVSAALPTPRNTWDTFEVVPSQTDILVEMQRIENRIGRIWGVVGERITMGRLVGQFNQIFGIMDASAQLAALNVIATSKAIFPDIVLVGAPGTPPILLNGEWVDGRLGINQVTATDVKVIQTPPPPTTGVMQDRLERSARSLGNLPAQWDGESPSNIATGRMGEFVLGAATTPRIAEYHLVGAQTLTELDKVMMLLAKNYGELRKGSFYVELGKTKGPVDYDAQEHFETVTHTVSYPVPGADAGSLGVDLMQRVGAGLMSKRTAAELDPFVKDVPQELDRIKREAAEMMAQQAVQQELATGRMALMDFAGMIRSMYDDGLDWAEAVLQQQKIAQERQAAQVPAGAPEAQPGLSVPGQGAESAAIPPPNASTMNLTDLLRSLSTPQRTEVQDLGNAATLQQTQQSRATVQ